MPSVGSHYTTISCCMSHCGAALLLACSACDVQSCAGTGCQPARWQQLRVVVESCVGVVVYSRKLCACSAQHGQVPKSPTATALIGTGPITLFLFRLLAWDGWKLRARWVGSGVERTTVPRGVARSKALLWDTCSVLWDTCCMSWDTCCVCKSVVARDVRCCGTRGLGVWHGDDVRFACCVFSLGARRAVPQRVVTCL
jgi:hypothetical protein